MSLLDKFKKKAPTQSRDPDSKDIGQELKTKSIKKDRPVLDNKKALNKPIRVVNKKQTLQAYKVIKGPHITEKATWLADQNKHVFKVYNSANKIEVKKAIETLYGVKVDNVRMIHSAPKKRRLGKHEGWRKGLKQGFKKAVVTLKKGQKIEVSPK